MFFAWKQWYSLQTVANISYSCSNFKATSIRDLLQLNCGLIDREKNPLRPIFSAFCI